MEDAREEVQMWPVVAASIWGYILLLLAWQMASEPRGWNYVQLGVPFTVALLGLLTDSRRWRFLALWIAGWGASLFAALFLTSGIGLLVLPVVAVYLWTAWRWNRAGRPPRSTDVPGDET
jgi:hypothetical protein